MKRILGALSASLALAALGAAVVGPYHGGRASAFSSAGSPRALQQAEAQAAAKGVPAKLVVNPADYDVAYVAARILGGYHYNHHPIDVETTNRLFDRYLDTLDPLHLFFFQSDMAEFDALRKTAGENLWRKGDVSPASIIFARLIERVDQQAAWVKDELKSEKFKFDSNDSYSLNRKNAPRPANLEDAKKQWMERLRYEYLQEKLNRVKPEDIIKTLTRRYERTARTLHELDSDDVFELYLTSLAQAYDPHSSYMGKPSLDAFNISMRLSLSGIGAQLTSEDGYPKIAELVPGGPAAKSGQLKVGDRITAVAQAAGEPVDVVDMKINKVVEMIRGPKGTEVKLTIWPVDATDPSIRKVITIVRDQVKLEEQESKASVVDMPDGKGGMQRIAVIDVPSFYEDVTRRGRGGKSTSADVARLLKKLEAEKVAGIILDLRRNGGGSLEEAIRLTGLFIKDGPIVQVRDPDGKVTVDSDPDPNILYTGPLMVLTSRFSASASEILAGALQDYGRAIIVGDSSTHGKGTVQTLVQLGPVLQQRGIKPRQDPGALKLTIQKFYRASGASTQLRGVTPDIVLPSLASNADVGEKSLPYPLPWDTVPSAKYTAFNMVQPYLAEIRKRSDARIASSREYSFLKEDIARFKKLMEDRTVSLNEATRLKEKEEAKARAEARKKALAAHPGPKLVVRQLTLRQVDLPGLPAPTGETTAQNTQKRPAGVDAESDATGDTQTPASLAGDITLHEAEHILHDLVALSASRTAARSR